MKARPNTPHFGRFWEIVQKYKVTILYTAPTAIRAFIKWGDEHVTKFNLSSLRLLGSVGEPINPEAWMWYHERIGGGRCPIVDTWWQTETGAIMITPLPGVTPTKPGTATLPSSGSMPPFSMKTATKSAPMKAASSSSANPGPPCCAPSTATPSATRKPYWSAYKNIYLAGDSSRRDEDGYFWIMGRIDDVLNVSGHRSHRRSGERLVSHAAVAEAAVVAVRMRSKARPSSPSSP